MERTKSNSVYIYELDGIPYEAAKAFVDAVRGMSEELKEYVENTNAWGKMQRRKDANQDLAEHLVREFHKKGRNAFQYRIDNHVIYLPTEHEGKVRDDKVFGPLPPEVPPLIDPFTPDSKDDDHPKEEGSQSRKDTLEDKARDLGGKDSRFFDPADIGEGIEWRDRSIIYRRGQPKFRQDLLCAYGGRCAVTGCDAEAALEACHIVPYREEGTNRVTNGLLLRADIHTLFDLHLITVDSVAETVLVAPSLKGTTYGDLQGLPMKMPADKTRRPNQADLAEHRQDAESTWR